jgi:hypothetical protein
LALNEFSFLKVASEVVQLIARCPLA